MEVSPAPTIDFTHLLSSANPETKSEAISQIAVACKSFGFFNVINHGISDETVLGAVESNAKFFDSPSEEKEEFQSGDVRRPVRFGTLAAQSKLRNGDGGTFARDFLKLYGFPLEDWIGFWPKNPPDYRLKMGRYTKEARNLSLCLFESILESLDIDPTPFIQKLTSEGMQMMAVNHYHTGLIGSGSTQTGIPPHTDFSLITVLLQTKPGLHVFDPTDGKWKDAPGSSSSMQVLVGDHLEVLSNGRCKAAVHRAACGTNSEEFTSRISVASLLTFGFDEVVEPVLVTKNQEEEVGKSLYKGSSLREFLEYLSSGEKLPFIDTLKVC